MGNDEEAKRRRVESIHQEYTFDQVQANCGFPLLKAKEILTAPIPTEEELEVLRTQVDPNHHIIGR